MQKIPMTTPLVEIDGDEMTRVMWAMIKERLLVPHVDLKTEYYDLGLRRRDETDDRITTEAALAIRKYGVGVKCATITPNAQRVEEYGLKSMWKSPNGTIRGILDGTVFRAPIVAENLRPLIPAWTRPIAMARHAYGDIYSCVESAVAGGEQADLVVSRGGVETRRLPVHRPDQGAGVVCGMHNVEKSIANFAHACFDYALEQGIDLWFATKDTISKIYHHRFKDIFQDLYDREYRDRFREKGIEYFYTLIDDAVARIMRSGGGMLWACMNYDGDVMSDMVATVFGSLSMMTSVLVSPGGCYEYEAAHGTVTRHYYRHLKGEQTSTNPMATLYAWTGALRRRAQLDGNGALREFADRVERAALETVESGVMTGDVAHLSVRTPRIVSTSRFIDAVAERL